jgi:hypothetical protein
MSTTLNRGSSWTNSDGLVVGFGVNKPVKEGAPAKTFGVQKRAVHFKWDDMSGVNIPVPAGSRILDVRLKVHAAFAGGTSLAVGDGTTAAGFITATAGATANLLAGAVIMVDGVYSYDDTADGDVTAAELKKYATADTIDLTVAGTFTAGEASLEVTYI